MLGDVNKFETLLSAQAAKQREHHAAELAGQKALPMDMPQTKPDPIMAMRKDMGMTEDEISLSCNILIAHVVLSLKAQTTRHLSEEAYIEEATRDIGKYERKLIEKHREIVAKAVAAARVPAAGSF